MNVFGGHCEDRVRDGPASWETGSKGCDERMLFQGHAAATRGYRDTSLIRNRPPYDPTAGLCLGPCGGPSGGGSFLMSEVPL